MAPSLLKSRQPSSEVESVLPLLDRLEQGETLTFEVGDEVYSLELLGAGAPAVVRACVCGDPNCMAGRLETRPRLQVLYGSRGATPDLAPPRPHAQLDTWQAWAAVQIAALVAGRKLSQLHCGTMIASTIEGPAYLRGFVFHA